RLDYLTFLDLAAGCGNRHRGRDHVADGGVFAVMAAHHPDQQDLPRTGVVRHLQPRLLLNHDYGYFAFSTMATTRQRLSCESGRVSMIRTRSPTLHWFCSSWALKRVDCWMCFLYLRCSLRVCTRTTTVLSILSLMTVPVRVLRIARSVVACSSVMRSTPSRRRDAGAAWGSAAPARSRARRYAPSDGSRSRSEPGRGARAGSAGDSAGGRWPSGSAG